jgi:hypothetical protein
MLRNPLLLATAFSTVALAGCATLDKVPPHTPLAQIESQFGRPNAICPLAGGGHRVIWTQQPMGQYGWAANVGPDGVADQVLPILTDEHFALLAQGDWPAERVRCEFGPPADIRGVGLPSVYEEVWAYRYRESKAWNSLMYVYMGRDGSRMTHYHPGPDPMYERGNDGGRGN